MFDEGIFRFLMSSLKSMGFSYEFLCKSLVTVGCDGDAMKRGKRLLLLLLDGSAGIAI
jgi:hypothetical protein